MLVILSGSPDGCPEVPEWLEILGNHSFCVPLLAARREIGFHAYRRPGRRNQNSVSGAHLQVNKGGLATELTDQHQRRSLQHVFPKQVTYFPEIDPLSHLSW